MYYGKKSIIEEYPQDIILLSDIYECRYAKECNNNARSADEWLQIKCSDEPTETIIEVSNNNKKLFLNGMPRSFSDPYYTQKVNINDICRFNRSLIYKYIEKINFCKNNIAINRNKKLLLMTVIDIERNLFEFCKSNNKHFLTNYEYDIYFIKSLGQYILCGNGIFTMNILLNDKLYNEIVTMMYINNKKLDEFS